MTKMNEELLEEIRLLREDVYGYKVLFEDRDSLWKDAENRLSTAEERLADCRAEMKMMRMHYLRSKSGEIK